MRCLLSFDYSSPSVACREGVAARAEGKRETRSVFQGAQERAGGLPPSRTVPRLRIFLFFFSLDVP